MSLTQLRSRGILDGTITAGDFASGVGGKVLQVVSSVLSSQTTISLNNAEGDIGLSATITPSSASNKILILYKLGYSNASGDTFVGHLVRGSTKIFQGDNGTGREGSISFQTANMNNYWSFEAGGSFLDSPSTTSSTTYKITVACGGNQTMYFNRTARGDAGDPAVSSSITLMEIAG
jgi:hypothetical protein